MFDADARTGQLAIVHLVCGAEFLPSWLLLGLLDHQRGIAKTLKASVLIHITAFRKGVACFICQPFVMLFTFTGGTEKQNVTSYIDDDIILERMAFFLPL